MPFAVQILNTLSAVLLESKRVCFPKEPGLCGQVLPKVEVLESGEEGEACSGFCSGPKSPQPIEEISGHCFAFRDAVRVDETWLTPFRRASETSSSQVRDSETCFWSW